MLRFAPDLILYTNGFQIAVGRNIQSTKLVLFSNSKVEGGGVLNFLIVYEIYVE